VSGRREEKRGRVQEREEAFPLFVATIQDDIQTRWNVRGAERKGIRARGEVCSC